MGDVCDADLKARDKTFANLPLPPIETRPWVEPLDFELSFAILEVLIKTHSMTVTTTNPFVGYFPLQLLVWFFLQVALDKNVLRTWVCVYALRLLMSTGHYR
jgi:hypothetical protein